ncbi:MULTISPECIES: mannitol dehydrogenase family protein [Subtercola]|uniref:Mannitol-1-phosphate 5-dehydrogenase n=1 Tax=Subtercola vilae TaxID=2056433 RepID=A0A4T2C8S3_9MICO|nr:MULTISPECIES: mannitol dehydrogenase family protein [Subtercola]MEA9983854.1 mannitol dehydrogenase family protein [Subtercola sp. RTI3]TIH40610.1 mannitol dehydrogenase family protein [Subtercola vilae]
MPRLTRSSVSALAAEVRMVHLGLGAFHRSHQAWYTQHASDSSPTPEGLATPGAGGSVPSGTEPWGIHGFTGRTARAAEQLTAQDGLYTLLTASPTAVTAEVIGSIVAATDGGDAVRWRAAVSDPRVSVLTLTITEAGYHTTPDGTLDLTDAAVRDDIARLKTGALPHTGIARLLDGLIARRAAGSGPLAVMSCDNLVSNGELTRAALTALAEQTDSSMADWMHEGVSFVSSMVDRITPATTPADVVEAQRITGFDDECPVMTEDFTEWIFEGDFPAGRPDWERSGARHVSDVRPYEQRKLRLLNGAHSLLAYTGLARGHSSIDQTMGDAFCRQVLEQFWAEARPTVTGDAGDLGAFTDRLVERFENRRIVHSLAQIARDGEQKIAIRVLPVLRFNAANGGELVGAAMALAAWINFTQTAASPTAADCDHSAERVLERIAPDLAGQTAVTHAVADALTEIRSSNRTKAAS